MPSAPPAAETDWRFEFRSAIRDADTLCQRLALPDSFRRAAADAAKTFPVFVPESYLSRMEVGNRFDPLLRQVLPVAEELAEIEGFGLDPVGDQAARHKPGLIQKYRQRVLLITTGQCAVHCRYCFRRHYPYAEEPGTLATWEDALTQIRQDGSLREVILSGGDPLSLSDGKLAPLLAELQAVPHLKRLRIHTRLPIMIPARVTEDLLASIQDSRLTPYVVIHANHANELGADVGSALAALRRAGAQLLNQAVLLKGINDSVAALRDLCEALCDFAVLPYYLNQLDRVQGAAHFEVPIPRGRELIDALRCQLPGYAVPRYVQEIAGAPHKIVLR